MAQPEGRSLSAPPPLPPGFVLDHGPGWYVAGREELLRRPEAAGLVAGPGLLERLREAGQPGEVGRAATSLLTWPGGGPELVVRTLLHGGWLGGLTGARFLDRWRPVRELGVAAALRAGRVPVPVPAFAAGERRAGTWRLAHASQSVRDVRDGLAFLEGMPSEAVVEVAAGAAGRAVRAFHDAGAVHADLHLKNLLVRRAAAGWEVLVIDLDGTRLGAPPDPRVRMRQLMRLHRSLEKRGLRDAVGPHGIESFLAAYCDGDPALREALLLHRDAELRRIAWHRLTWRR